MFRKDEIKKDIDGSENRAFDLNESQTMLLAAIAKSLFNIQEMMKK